MKNHWLSGKVFIHPLKRHDRQKIILVFEGEGKDVKVFQNNE